jgi:biotin carboxylase
MQSTMPPIATSVTAPQKTLVLFNYDWDIIGFERANPGPPGNASYHFSTAGFDLFSFPSNANLAWFDIERFVARLARQAKARGWTAVVSNHEQFGALAAAMLAERMGWPGTSVKAVLACQHKLYARQVLARVCPQANVEFAVLDTQYGAPVPDGLTYPLFVKPVKAAFSVLARIVNSREELYTHTRFGGWELWVIRHLVEPFERVFQKRLGPAQSAHRMMVEQPVNAAQFNLDGYVWQGKAAMFGVVDAIMYPGTQAFMRWDLPSRLPVDLQQRALQIAQVFLSSVGFDLGMFNMEFFYDEASDRITVIEFNPRMASQFSDLYLRVMGVDLHACVLAMAHGRHPDSLPRARPTAGAASSLVYRSFSPGDACPMPDASQVKRFQATFMDGLLFPFPKDKGSTARDFKWLGSYRYGIVHLGGCDAADLKARADAASAMLGWPSPYLDHMDCLDATGAKQAVRRPAQTPPLEPIPHPRTQPHPTPHFLESTP